MTIRKEVTDFLIREGFQIVRDEHRVTRFSLDKPGEQLNIVVSSKLKSRDVPIRLRCERCKFEFTMTQYSKHTTCYRCGHEATIIHLSQKHNKK